MTGLYQAGGIVTKESGPHASGLRVEGARLEGLQRPEDSIISEFKAWLMLQQTEPVVPQTACRSSRSRPQTTAGLRDSPRIFV